MKSATCTLQRHCRTDTAAERKRNAFTDCSKRNAYFNTALNYCKTFTRIGLRCVLSWFQGGTSIFIIVWNCFVADSIENIRNANNRIYIIQFKNKHIFITIMFLVAFCSKKTWGIAKIDALHSAGSKTIALNLRCDGSVSESLSFR